MTTTTKHAEKLATRRAEYGDRRQSQTITRMANEILAANPTINMGEARSRALKAMIAKIEGR